MNKRYIIILIAVSLFLLLVLTGCQDKDLSTTSDSDIQTAIAQTQAAQPTSTQVPPTPIVLSEIDLVPVLIQPGDLPAGFTGAQIRDTHPPMGWWEKIPTPDNFIYQQFAKGADEGGSVQVLLYDNLDDSSKAFSIMKGNTPIEGVGSEAYISARVGIGLDGPTDLLSIHLAVIRCHAVVYIYMKTDRDSIIAYAQKLDARLEPLVCQQ